MRNGHPTSSQFPLVQDSVALSKEAWAKDLNTLFEHAETCYGDIKWEGREGCIWGHKSLVYVRAPRIFKEENLLPSAFAVSSPTLNTGHVIPYQTIKYYGSNNVLESQLKWMYTGVGVLEILDWTSKRKSPNADSSSMQSGDMPYQMDRLSQDLTYMWRSKIYADVQIHLSHINTYSGPWPSGKDTQMERLQSPLAFSHRFILASRSEYLSSILENSALQEQTMTAIVLPSPPFTASSLHFCLGYIYAGHLCFSNRTLNLFIALRVHLSATFLHLVQLVQEIESRIVYDLCHGMDWSSCCCPKCLIRIPRVWLYATQKGVLGLEARARAFLVHAWEHSWGKEVALAPQEWRVKLVENVIASINSHNVASAIQSISSIRSRATKLSVSHEWTKFLIDMVDSIEKAVFADFSNNRSSSEISPTAAQYGKDTSAFFQKQSKQAKSPFGTLASVSPFSHDRAILSRRTPLPLPKSERQNSKTPGQPEGLLLQVGIPCVVLLRKKRFRAWIRYIGSIQGFKGSRVGIAVQDLCHLGIDTLPSGSYRGVHYFDTIHKSHGTIEIPDADDLQTKHSDFGKEFENDEDWKKPCRALFVKPKEILFIIHSNNQQ
nr:hypothetical protein L203_06392 [Cryptococcus depauperatus CBS 7841]